ncbi:MAG: sugar transferase [Geminicoccaceae bacterium]
MMLAALLDKLAHSRYRRLIITAHDLTMLTAAFPISIFLRENFDPDAQHIVPAAYGSAVLFMIALFVFRVMGVQQNMWRYSSPRDLMVVARALFIVTAIFVPAMFLIDRLDGIPRSVLVIFWFVAFAGLCSTRLLYIWAVTWIDGRPHSMSRWERCRILVLASIRPSSTVIQSVNIRCAHKVQIVGVVSEDAERGRTLLGIEVLGNAKRLPQILASLDIVGSYPHAIILDEADEPARHWLMDHLETAAPSIPVFRSTAIGQLSQFVDKHQPRDQLITFNSNPKSYLEAKRMIDIAAASIGLVFLSPLLVLIAGLLYLLHGAPIMFTQARAGRYLQEFRLVKFRTMREPFDSTGKALDDKDRVTRLGLLLRATRLDELPQFWNVLRGDMSLIGPRPLLHRDMPSDAHILAERYSVRPGITGWAQVNGGHQVENHQKMALDIYYIRNASLGLDAKVLFMTVKMMLFGESVDRVAINQATNLTIEQQ